MKKGTVEVTLLNSAVSIVTNSISSELYLFNETEKRSEFNKIIETIISKSYYNILEANFISELKKQASDGVIISMQSIAIKLNVLLGGILSLNDIFTDVIELNHSYTSEYNDNDVDAYNKQTNVVIKEPSELGAIRKFAIIVKLFLDEINYAEEFIKITKAVDTKKDKVV